MVSCHSDDLLQTWVRRRLSIRNPKLKAIRVPLLEFGQIRTRLCRRAKLTRGGYRRLRSRQSVKPPNIFCVRHQLLVQTSITRGTLVCISRPPLCQRPEWRDYFEDAPLDRSTDRDRDGLVLLGDGGVGTARRRGVSALAPPSACADAATRGYGRARNLGAPPKTPQSAGLVLSSVDARHSSTAPSTVIATTAPTSAIRLMKGGCHAVCCQTHSQSPRVRRTQM